MRDKKDFIIDGVNYQIYPMSPLKANRILLNLTKIFGETIANFILGYLKGNTDKKALDTDLKDMAKGLKNAEAFVKAFSAFSKDIDPDVIEKFLLSLLPKEHIIADQKKVMNIDQHLEEYGLMHLYKLCWASLQANFTDFLDAAAEHLG